MAELSSDLANALREALTAHKADVAPTERQDRHDERMALMEHLEREAFETIEQLIGPQLAAGKYPDGVKALVGRILSPQHPVELGPAAGIVIAIGYIIGNAAMAGPAAQLAKDSLYNFGGVPPSPNGVVDAVVTKRMDHGVGVDKMRESGWTVADAEAMIKAGVSSLSPSLWIEFWRRYPALGATVEQGLSHSGLDEMSVAALQALRWAPPSAETAIVALLKGHLSYDDAAAIVGQNGIDPVNTAWLRASAGRPPGIQEMLTLWRRGKTTEARVNAAVRQSDINDDFLPEILELRYHSQPFRSIVSSFRKKVIDEPTARLWLDYVGILPEQVDAIIREASTGTATSVKNLSPSTVEKLYARGKYDRATAMASLEALGYDATEAGLLLDLVDDDKAHSAQNRGATKIGTRYVSWKIDRTKALQSLDAIGVPVAWRDELLDVWDVEREAQTLHLSMADLKAGHKKGTIGIPTIRERLLGMGHDAVDTDFLIATYFS